MFLGGYHNRYFVADNMILCMANALLRKKHWKNFNTTFKRH